MMSSCGTSRLSGTKKDRREGNFDKLWTCHSFLRQLAKRWQVHQYLESRMWMQKSTTHRSKNEARRPRQTPRTSQKRGRFTTLAQALILPHLPVYVLRIPTVQVQSRSEPITRLARPDDVSGENLQDSDLQCPRLAINEAGHETLRPWIPTIIPAIATLVTHWST